MSGPWEKFASAPADGPWSKFANQAEATVAPPAPAKREPMGALNAATQGGWRSLADVLGFVPDMVNTAVNVPISASNWLLGTEIPKVPMVSDSLADVSSNVAKNLGLDVRDTGDMTGGEKLAYNSARFGSGAAASGPVMARQAVKVAPDVAASMSRPLLDILSGLGQALGVTAAQELDAGPVGEAAAGLAGAMAGNATGASVAGAHKQAKGLFGASGVGGESPVIADTAAAHVRGAALDPVAAADEIKAARSRYAEAGLPTQGAGVMSNDEGLMALERGARTAPDTAPTAMKQDRELRTALGGKLGQLDPGADVPSQPLVDSLRSEVDSRRAAASGAVKSAEADVAASEAAEQGVAERLRQEPGAGAQASVDLDNVIVEQTLKPMRERLRQMREGIDPEGSIRVPGDGMVAAVDRMESDLPVGGIAGDQVPQAQASAIRRDYTDAAGAPKDVSFRDAQRLRPALSEGVNKARMSGDYAKADNLKAMKAELDAMVERLAEDGSPAGQRAREYLNAHRDEFAPLFDEGAGGRFRKALNADGRDRANTPASATGGRFVHSGAGAGEDAASLAKILKASPAGSEGRGHVRTILLSQASGAIEASGKVNLRSLDKWIDSYKPVLDQFPEVSAEITKLRADALNGRDATARLQSLVGDAKAGVDRTEAGIQASALRLALSDPDPKNLIKGVFSDGPSANPSKRMQELVEMTKHSEAASKGLRKAVSDYLTERLTNTASEATSDSSYPVSFDKVSKLMRSHEQALTALYGAGSQEMKALREVQGALRDMSRRANKASIGSNTAEDFRRALNAAGHGATPGRLAHVVNAVSVIGKVVPAFQVDRRVNELVNRAMFDPDLALMLLAGPKNANSPSAKAWGHRVSLLMGVTGSEEKEEKK